MKIWVYGSLKRDHGNGRLLKTSRFLGTAISEPEFTLLNLGSFPGIVREGTTAIHGEVYEVDDETLQRLDRLEGHPSFYERQHVAVTLDDGSTAQVEGYVLPSTWLLRQLPLIPTGVWTR